MSKFDDWVQKQYTQEYIDDLADQWAQDHPNLPTTHYMTHLTHIGGLAEELFEETLNKAMILKDFEYERIGPTRPSMNDFIIHTNPPLKIDVKTRTKGKTSPDPAMRAWVAKKQINNQHVNFYIFCYYQESERILTLIGGISKRRFSNLCKLVTTNDDPHVQEDYYYVTYDDLEPITNILQWITENTA